MQIILDTNVIVDYLDDREPFTSQAELIIELCSQGKVTGHFTANTATDIYYIMKKVAGNEKTRELLQAMAAILDIIDTTKDDVINALSSSMADYEDAVLSECAKRGSIEYIITRNTKDFEKSKVPPLTPEDFISMLNENTAG